MIFNNFSNITTIDGIIVACFCAIFAAFYGSGFFLVYKLKDKNKDIRNYQLSIALFFLMYGTARLIMFIFELTFDEGFVWNILSEKIDQIFIDHPSLELRHEIVWRTTTGLGSAGLAILMYQLEKRILEKKTKYIFTILQIVTVIPALIWGVEGKDVISIVRIILYAGNFLVIAIPLFYFYYAFKTVGETRKRAIGAAIGIFILFMGIVCNSSIGKNLFSSGLGIEGLHLSYYLFAAFTVAGIAIYMKSVKF